MDWNVHEGSYDAATNLAIDDLMLQKAAEEEEAYLRIYDFEDPAVILARNEHINDVREFRESHEYTRRDTGGSVIYCDENAIFYSISIPTEQDEFPEELHREYFGPLIAEALSDLGVEEEKLGIGEHFSVRISGKTVSGNSQRKKSDAVLYHGVLAIEPWDIDELEELIHLREKNGETEKEFIESLPGVLDHVEHDYERGRELAKEFLIQSFTGGDYEEIELTEEDWKEIESLTEEKYRDEDWLHTAKGSESLEAEQGFCFVDWTDEWDEEVRDFGFY